MNDEDEEFEVKYKDGKLISAEDLSGDEEGEESSEGKYIIPSSSHCVLPDSVKFFL